MSCSAARCIYRTRFIFQVAPTVNSVDFLAKCQRSLSELVTVCAALLDILESQTVFRCFLASAHSTQMIRNVLNIMQWLGLSQLITMN